MNKIRPLIISRTLPYLGGREVMVDEIIRHLSKKGTVWVLTPDKYKKSKRIIVINKKDFSEDLIKIFKSARINIVNCHTFYFFNIASQIAERLDIPLVFTLHGVFIGIYGKKYHSIIKRISEKSSLVITVSRMYLRKLKKSFSSNKGKFIKVQNGIKVLKSGLQNNKSSKIKYIIVPARLNKLKGLEYIAKASRQLKDIKFCICHPVGRDNNIEEDKYKNKLSKESHNILRFKRLDHEKMLLEMRKADLIILPSLMEGISISILESMSLGKIVAATNIGGNPEIIKDGVNGFLFKPRSVNAILKIIDRISEINTGNKMIISQNAVLTVRNKFNINTMLKQYKNILNNLINYGNK